MSLTWNEATPWLSVVEDLTKSIFVNAICIFWNVSKFSAMANNLKICKSFKFKRDQKDSNVAENSLLVIRSYWHFFLLTSCHLQYRIGKIYNSGSIEFRFLFTSLLSDYIWENTFLIIMETCLPLPLPKKELHFMVNNAKDWAIAHGRWIDLIEIVVWTFKFICFSLKVPCKIWGIK